MVLLKNPVHGRFAIRVLLRTGFQKLFATQPLRERFTNWLGWAPWRTAGRFRPQRPCRQLRDAGSFNCVSSVIAF